MMMGVVIAMLCFDSFIHYHLCVCVLLPLFIILTYIYRRVELNSCGFTVVYYFGVSDSRTNERTIMSVLFLIKMNGWMDG
jgi:hypothetical protein